MKGVIFLGQNGDVSISNTKFSECSSGDYGGAIYTESSLTSVIIDSCLFDHCYSLGIFFFFIYFIFFFLPF
jgi:predicted outer membrane repeat protein